MTCQSAPPLLASSYVKNLQETCKTMSKLRQKIPRLKLPLTQYQKLRIEVLRRDGWRCQRCGKSNDLHVHHLKSRGNLGDDMMRNLITLCAKCHEAFHRPLPSIPTIDSNKAAEIRRISGRASAVIPRYYLKEQSSGLARSRSFRRHWNPLRWSRSSMSLHR